MNGRLLTDAPQPGAWNMGVDEALLDQAIAGEDAPTLRWYRWSRPTLSLGYFQSYDDRPDELATLDCVRRLSGGGAILHDLEITYSLTIPRRHWPGRDPRRLVTLWHQHLVNVLNDLLGSDAFARLHEDSPSDAPEPYLCFLRRSNGDVLVGDDKVMGSAQRTRRDVLLQHGSLLLRSHPLTPRIPGLCDLCPKLEPEDVSRELISKTSTFIDVKFLPGDLASEELSRAKLLSGGKYQSTEWTAKR